MRGARWIAGGAATAAAVILSLPGAMAAVAGVRVSVGPAADTYVSAARRTQNFGAARTLLAGPGPRTRIFMRFDLRGQDARVVKARLRLYARRGSRGSVAVSTAADPFWAESSVTYARHPRA